MKTGWIKDDYDELKKSFVESIEETSRGWIMIAI